MIVQNLIECYVNEKSSKAILKYKKEVVDYFYQKLLEQKEKYKIFIAGKSNIIKSIYELEIERMEFLLREYLIIRLEKMKEDYYIDLNLLSSQEVVYYTRLQKIAPFKNKKNDKIEVIGFLCKKDLGNVILDDENVEMCKDDFFVGPLNDVYDLIINEDIKLV